MTNFEILMSEIKEPKQLAELMEGYGKCQRCSNLYWDGNQSMCHVNSNESSCVQGIQEWLESESTENLQLKYKKEYFLVKHPLLVEPLKRIYDLVFDIKNLSCEKEKYCKHRCDKYCHWSGIAVRKFVTAEVAVIDYAHTLLEDEELRNDTRIEELKVALQVYSTVYNYVEFLKLR